MNLVILYEDDIKSDGTAVVTGRRARHIRDIHRAEKGKKLKAGILNGKMGSAEVIGITDDSVEMLLNLNRKPPEKLPFTLICALPRPKSLKKVLHISACMGIKKVIFIGSWKVEKSYWSSPVLSEECVREHLILGLEQGVDTVMPEIIFKRRFKPFAEDEMPNIIKGSRALLADSEAETPCPSLPGQHVTLAVGPEGGFTDYEKELFIKQGFEPVSLGRRILRVEYAVTALTAKISS